MIKKLERYYMNTDTQEVITRKQFENMMNEYIEKNDPSLRYSDIEEYFDEIIYIGKFASLEDARNECELSL